MIENIQMFQYKPINPIMGSCFHDPGDNKTYFYDGTSWTELSIVGNQQPKKDERIRKIRSIYE